MNIFVGISQLKDARLTTFLKEITIVALYDANPELCKHSTTGQQIF